MLEFKVTGKTINQAIQNGIEKLGVNKENVEIKVLTPPQNFKDAEVLICVPKVFATPELEDLFAVQNIDNQIAKTQKSVQKRRKEKNEILEMIKGQKYTLQRSKGLGENQPDMMNLTTMNPETRRLVRVLPEDAQRTAEMFDLLLGDNLQGRKDFIAENGYLYLDDVDVS